MILDLKENCMIFFRVSWVKLEVGLSIAFTTRVIQT